ETNDDGLKSRTAWAGAGDGVLFYDADGDGAISEKREYVFTEWDPTASSDIEALANVFDSNGDGIFDAFDDAWADFRVMVTNADGSHTARSLADLGIISISLDPDATSIELPDGSMITGQTTFTWADGSTGLVGDVVLATEEQGYDVESVVTVDGSGNRTEVQTGYAGDGSIAFVVTSATSAEGSLIVNRYDDDGDGVVDRLQTIATTTDLDGSETRSVTNSLGNDQSTAVIQNAVSTTKSPDGANVLIERDTTGGGWFDQVESREEQPDGSWLNTMSYLAHDGSLQRKVTETVSADGLTRVEEIDEDGDGNLNFSVNHTIVVNGDGSRAETTTTTNNDGSLRSSMVETASADGRTKTVSYDRDGDGVFEEIVDTVIAVNSDGSTTSTRVVKNDDGSIRSSSTIGQSDDTLTKTTNADVDGDGDIDTSIVEQVTIASDGAREEQITVTNVDGSVREMTKVILDGDKIGGQTWVDLNRDGAFDPSELVRETVVHPVSGEVTTTVFDRADDGSVHGHTTTLTSTDGLVSVTTVDADGNGFSDTVISEAKVANGDGSSSTTTDVRNGDGSLRSTSVSTSSSDGLQTVVEADLDADGVVESRTEIQRQSNGDGSNGVTTHIHADDGTLLSSSHDLYSSDRLAHTRSSDTDGDGAVDWEVARVTSLDGETTVNDRRFHPDGSLASQTLTVTSSNGLLTTTSSDADGDGVYENTTYSVTVLNSDGSRTTSVTVQNADGTDRSQTRETVSDDALSIIQEVDQNADGVFDTTTQTSTNFAQNGSTITTAVVSAADGSVIRRSLEEVSDDGLRKVTGLDPDGDGSFDLITTVARTLLADGGFSELLEVRGSGGELRSAVTESLSGDGNNRTILRDVDGDGLIDARETQTEAPDGTTELITESLAPDGSVQSRTVSMISADGLTVTEERDIDGDGTADLISDNKTTLEADGSRKSVTQNLS
ncbi:MAG: hemolysin, partial [Planctomycetota bacterium]